MCSLYFEGSVCPNCGSVARVRERPVIEVMDGDLKEVRQVKLNDREPEDRRTGHESQP